MEPKEKAEDLWLTFYQLLPDGIYSDYAAKEEARKFALVAVYEMISNAGFIWGGADSETGLSARDAFREYWNKVKQEIEKL